MDYLRSKKLYSALKFAESLINKYANGNQDIDKARDIACKYYKLNKDQKNIFDRYIPTKHIYHKDPKEEIESGSVAGEYDPRYGFIRADDILCYRQIDEDTWVVYKCFNNYQISYGKVNAKGNLILEL